jgi:glycosidase
MGNSNVALMDFNTENVEVQDTLIKLIRDFVRMYQIDGLRIDGKIRGDSRGPTVRDFEC